ncbi:polysaccharide deacetylase family protein [Chryseobacterium shigense]|uniref:Peptidoglycan/xylan/chitin deacetylase (PgdA/CDA1 family) n=1 Tax=Chryseobacterium shigense TaxID=297244 RepID=A0A841NAS0_9FLAO|nr:polysaccharide deacetylase family protein [Chryseobacterium shigense]MBB6369092.1 peptidoglycan/xylan/chitin deacetylase (PgdA/CDA1 family) [Chryseobacterium shigense]
MKDNIINLLAAFETENIGKSFPMEYCLPVYHCVSDEKLPHIRHIIQYKNTRQFEEDLDYLSKHFQFVSWAEFKDFVNGHFKPEKKIALLTFDDGFREFYDTVLPVLERKGIYACNFINPAFIDNRELMFRCKASLIIDAAEKAKTVDPEIYSILSLENPSKENLKQKVLKIGYHEKDLLDSITEKLEIDCNAYLREYKPYLTTDQLKTLTQKGYGISSHSWDHPKYGELTLQEQMESTNRTFNYLKENGFIYESFAFPFTDFGVKKDFFDELFKNKEMFCSFGSAGAKWDSVERNFHRIPMEMGESGEQILKKETAYFRLKKIINKNKIVRR